MPVPDLEHRRVAVLGVGRDGQSAWRYLRRKHPDLLLTLIDERQPGPDVMQRLTANDRLLCGPFAEAGLDAFDVLVRSPGISPYRRSLRTAREGGAVITTPSNLWFAGHAGANTICVTGTKGKSTTSALLAHMLQSCGYRVCLAGNIGLPLLDCDDRCVDWWVIELSSYQLSDLQADPALSLILNLTPEHLDWHGSEERYRADKLRLAQLAAYRPLVANAADPVLKAELGGRPNIVWFNDAAGFRVEAGRLYRGTAEFGLKLPPDLPGAHNLANVAAALTVLEQAGADPLAGMQSLSSFRPLPHRLQILGERGGRTYVDDSISSTPVATAAALESFAGRPVTLLVGGLDRGLDWAPYLTAFEKWPPNAVIGLPDSGRRIIRDMERGGLSPEMGLHVAEDLEAAIRLADDLTPPGGTVLLSPGAPSFPRFRDFRERGERFACWCGFEAEETSEPGNGIK